MLVIRPQNGEPDEAYFVYADNKISNWLNADGADTEDKNVLIGIYFGVSSVNFLSPFCWFE